MRDATNAKPGQRRALNSIRAKLTTRLFALGIVTRMGQDRYSWLGGKAIEPGAEGKRLFGRYDCAFAFEETDGLDFVIDRFAVGFAWASARCFADSSTGVFFQTWM